MKDYEIYTTRILSPSLVDMVLRWAGLRTGERKSRIKKTGFRIEEGRVLRTDKTEEGIRKYFNRKGLWVLSITECTRTKGQELQII